MIDTHRPTDPSVTELSSFHLSQHADELRESSAYQSSGKSSRALVKSPGLSMVLMALAEGAELKEHHAPGPATAVVLEGEILFSRIDRSGDSRQEQVLSRHECVAFSADLRHAVRAQKESLLLVTIGCKS